MTYKQIDTSREVRLWTNIIVGGIGTAMMVVPVVAPVVADAAVSAKNTIEQKAHQIKVKTKKRLRKEYNIMDDVDDIAWHYDHG